MHKTGFNSIQYSSDDTIKLEGITSLTISNYGTSIVTVVINDVPRNIPALKPEIGVPFGSFNLPGDGTACDITITFKFAGGAGNAILDYRKLINPTC